MRRLPLTFGLLCAVFSTFAQAYQVDTLYKSGPQDNRINVVILGDGFTESEMPKFTAEAKKFADFFRSYDPYDHYRDYFNFFAIRTPSKESGITNPGTAPDAYPDQPVETKDTFYGVSFGAIIHRMLNITKVEGYVNVLASQFPDYDLVIMLANTRYYGGAGGGVAIFSLHEQSNNVGVHEVGHTLSNLADEYWEGFYGTYLKEGPNKTMESSETAVKWKNWLHEFLINIYPHGSEGEAARWYKPASGTCLMEYNENAFCAVCREATVERILELVNPINGIEPDTAVVVAMEKLVTFKLDLLKPNPNSLEVEWYLNGERISQGGDKLILKPDNVPDGSNLVATVFDSTALSRKDGVRSLRKKEIRWSLHSALPRVFKVVASSDSVCLGDTVMLTSYGCATKVSWSTGETGESISINPHGSTIYKAECKVDGKPSLVFEVPVNVKPLPAATATNGGPYTIGQTVELSASGGIAYRWSGPRSFRADTPIASILNAGTLNSGIYKVKVTGANGCSKTVQTEVKVEPILSASNPQEMLVKVFPNPAKGAIKYETTLAGESEITLCNAAGGAVLSKVFLGRGEVLINLPAGIYLYRFRNGNREVSGKIAIE